MEHAEHCSNTILTYVNQVSNLKDKIQNEVNTLLINNNNNEEEISRLKLELNNTKNKYENLKKSNIEITKLLKEFEIKFNIKKQKSKDLKIKLKNLDDKINSFSNLISELNHTCAESEKFHMSLTNSLNNRMNEISYHRLTLNELDLKTNETSRKHSDNLKSLKNKFKKLKLKNNKLNKINENTYIEFNNLNPLINSINDSNYTLLCQIRQFQYTNLNLSRQLETVNRLNKQLTIEKKTMINSIDNYTNLNNKYELEINRSFNDYRNLIFYFITHYKKQDNEIDLIIKSLKRQQRIIEIKDNIIKKCFEKIKQYKLNNIDNTLIIQSINNNLNNEINKTYVERFQSCLIYKYNEIINEFLNNINNIKYTNIDKTANLVNSRDYINNGNNNRDYNLNNNNNEPIDNLNNNNIFNSIEPLRINETFKRNGYNNHFTHGFLDKINKIAIFINNILNKLENSFNKININKSKNKLLKKSILENETILAGYKTRLDLSELDKCSLKSELNNKIDNIEQLNNDLKNIENEKNNQIKLIENEMIDLDSKLNESNKKLNELELKKENDINNLMSKIVEMENKLSEIKIQNEKLNLALIEKKTNEKNNTRKLYNVNENNIKNIQQISSTPRPKSGEFSIPNTPLSSIRHVKNTSKKKISSGIHNENEDDVFQFK